MSRSDAQNQWRKSRNNWGGPYSYIHVSHRSFLLKVIVFTVRKHEYMNMVPPKLSRDLRH